MGQLNPLEFFLVVLKPVTVFSGIVNGTPADPYINITWNGGATGTASSIGTSGAPLEGNSIEFGTSAGGRERGITRLRTWSPSDGSGTAGTLKIAETSDVGPNIVSGDNITVKLFWQLWDKVPRQDASDPNNIIFYEDYDIGFTDQTVNWRPYADAGPPGAAFLEAGSAQVSFVGDRSFALAPGATLSSHLWTAHGSVEGTSSTQGTTASPVTFTWTTAGQYLVSLLETDSNGNTATNYTWAIIIDPAAPTNVAYTKFDAISDSFDAFQGGGSCGFTVHGVADVSQFPQESLVLHIARGNQTTPTATWPNRSNILYCGYITGDAIKQDPMNNTTQFRTTSIDGLMKKLAIYPVRLEDSSNPQNWTQAKDLTVDRVLSYLAHWRSTLSLMTNIRPLNYTAELKSQDFNAANLWGMFKALMGDAWGLPISDHQSTIYLVRDYNLMDTSERATATTRKTLQKGLWVANVDIAERGEYEQPVRKVKWNGVYYPGDEASAIPLFSEAPGEVQDTWGNEAAKSGFILTTQSDLNTRTGYEYARRNYIYPTVSMRFLNDGSFTTAPQEIFPANVEAIDNNRGLVWTPDLIPRSIRRSYNHQQGYIDYQVTFEPSVTGPAGATIIMPAKPASATGGGVSPSGDPPPAPPAWSQPTVSIPGPAVGADTTDGVYWTLNSGASWEERNNLLTVPQRAMQYLIWDPWWFTPDKQGTNDPEQVILWGCGLGFVAKSDDAGKNWQDLTPNIDDPPNTWADAPAPTVADLTFSPIHGNIHSNQQFWLLASATLGGSERSWVTKTSDDGATWTWFAFAGCEPVIEFLFGTTAPNVNVDGVQFTATSGPLTGPAYRLDIAVTPGGGCTCANYSIEVVSATNLTAYTAGAMTNCALTDVWRYNIQGYGALFDTWTCNHINFLSSTTGPWTCDFIITGGPASPDETKPVFMDIDNEDGSTLWLTAWSATEGLFVQFRDTEDFTLNSEDNLGASTLNELNNRTYYAAPYTPGLDKDILYVFGRMNAPQGLANPEHVIKTIDGGTSWTSVGDSVTWGTDWIGAFFEDAGGNLFAFRNGASRALYRSVDAGTTWTSLSSMPFDVEPGGMSVHPDGRILISNSATGAAMVAYAEAPDYSVWFDATGSPSFPTAGGGSNAVIWIT